MGGTTSNPSAVPFTITRLGNLVTMCIPNGFTFTKDGNAGPLTLPLPAWFLSSRLSQCAGGGMYYPSSGASNVTMMATVLTWGVFNNSPAVYLYNGSNGNFAANSTIALGYLTLTWTI